jgi:hypothetical protein
MPGHAPLFCSRCLVELHPGAGDFYEVSIQAVADPTPPTITAEDLKRDLRQEIRALIAQMEGMSKQELMDQVARRVTIHLCNQCFAQWIENPAG